MSPILRSRTTEAERIGFRAALLRIAVALFGMVVVPMAAPQPRSFWIVLAVYLLVALSVQWLIWRRRGAQWQRALLMGVLDYATLTFVVHLVGSAPSPLAGFYVFISMMYALVVSRALALGLAVYGASLYTLLLIAERMGWLPYGPSAPSWVAREPPGDALIVASALLGYVVAVGSALVVGNVAAALRAREDQLEELSKRDPLTQLFNRRHLLEQLAHELARVRRGHPLALAMIDLDGFKQVNDERGHLHGDQLLIRVAAALRDATRETDVVGRYGGDEFLVLLCDTRLEDAEQAARRLLDRVRAAGASIDGGPPITASVGLVSTAAGDDIEALLHRADANCYAAKHAGGDRVVASA